MKKYLNEHKVGGGSQNKIGIKTTQLQAQLLYYISMVATDENSC